MESKHKDILGNELKVGDVVITPSNYYKELSIRKIDSFTPKGIRVKTYSAGLNNFTGNRIILNTENSVCKIENSAINLKKF